MEAMRNKIKRIFGDNLREGQSLIEIIIGLAIGAILIGASALSIATMLTTNATTQKWRTATALSQGLLDNVRAYGSIDWQNLYSLNKSSSTPYFLNASGTTYAVVPGKEGLLDNDVLNGLVGEWRFDEDAATTSTMTYDATGNGNNGTFVSNPVRATSTCKIGNCLSFNGSSTYVDAGNGASLNFTAGITLSAWINPKAAGPATIVSKNGPFYLAYSGSRAVIAGVYTSPSTWTWVSGNTATPLNSWQFVAMTYDGANEKVYVNGSQDGVVSVTSTLVTTGATVKIGWGDPGFNQYFNGYIDDVRIYNRALSADEVRQIYNANTFRRYFYVENACRANDSTNSLTGVSPCVGGSSDDPSTQKISVATEWATVIGTSQSVIADYVTRWKNNVFLQNDWSGGANASGAVSTPTNLFSSSTNANFSGKSIRIQGL